MKIIYSFRGDLTDISGEKESLLRTMIIVGQLSQPFEELQADRSQKNGLVAGVYRVCFQVPVFDGVL